MNTTDTTAHRFAAGDRVRMIGSPGFLGTVGRYYKPLSSGNCNVLVTWDRTGDAPILESQIEPAEAPHRVDGRGAGTCDVCHGRLDYSWAVTRADGKTSTRCSTHLGTEYDRAAVWR